MHSIDDYGDVDVAIRFETADAEDVAQIEALFADDDVLQSKAFSGAEVITVIAKLTGTTLGKLLDFFAKKGSAAPKTSLEIGTHKISIKGFPEADLERLLESPGFKAAVKAVRAK